MKEINWETAANMILLGTVQPIGFEQVSIKTMTVEELRSKAEAGTIRFFVEEENLPPEEQPKTKDQKNDTKRSNLDDGKILALRNAGWTYKKIADEMGVSDATIISHLKKMQAAQPEEETDADNGQSPE